MILYPDYYCKNVFQLNIEFFKKHNIKGVILDVDNTLVDRKKVLSVEMIQWHKKIIGGGIKTIILSNSIHRNKVSSIADNLGIDYINFARKPFKFGLKRAIKKMNLQVYEVASIGDQIFTDVLGAKRMKCYSILVEPLSKYEPFRIKWQRLIENLIIKKYLKEIENSRNLQVPLDKS